MVMHKKILILFFVVVCCVNTVFAQRTSYGESALSISGGTTVSSFGGEVMYGYYLHSGYVFGDINFANRMEIDKLSNEQIHYPRLQFEGGYMFRFWANHSRSVNFYGGLSAFIGIELFDLYKTLSEPVRQSLLINGYKTTQFIYGTSPRLEAEFFVLPSFALIIKGRVPVICFNTKFPMVGWEAQAGVKINF